MVVQGAQSSPDGSAGGGGGIGSTGGQVVDQVLMADQDNSKFN